MNRSSPFILALALMLSAGSQAAAQDEVYPDDESVAAERCVNLGRVRNTEVLNDRNILFYMRGNKIYRNVLARRCPSLKENRTFAYRATINRLCDNDVIEVIIAPGMGQMGGPICTLGKFYLVSEEEAEALRKESEAVEELGLEDDLP